MGNEPAAGEPKPLDETLEELSTKIGNAVEAQEKRTRVLQWLLAAFATAAVLATAGAVTALVLLFGTIGDVRTQALAACGSHASQAGWEAAAEQQIAERVRETPGATPTVHWLVADLSEQARDAYEKGGCAEQFGPLPTPTPTR